MEKRNANDDGSQLASAISVLNYEALNFQLNWLLDESRRSGLVLKNLKWWF